MSKKALTRSQTVEALKERQRRIREENCKELRERSIAAFIGKDGVKSDE